MFRFILILAAIQQTVLAGPVQDLPDRKYREVGGTITRSFPGSDEINSERSNREVGGAITRMLGKRDSEELWTIIQTDEENLTMDNYRGKDVPLSLTSDFRGIEPVLPIEEDNRYLRVIY